MVIYADSLFILNAVIDYFLIKLSGVISHRSAVFWRLGLAAVIGGISSFYIFLPSVNIFLDTALKIILCSLLVFTAYGFENIKTFIKLTALLFGLTFLLGGIVSGIVFLYSPENIYSNNRITYIDIDPIIFILSGTAYYIIAVIIKHFTERNGEYAEECKVELYLNKTFVSLSGLIDTGNSLSDVFGLSEVIISGKRTLEGLKENLDDDEIKRRFRTVPVKTVTGNAVLEGLRIDKAIIKIDDGKKTLVNPIIVASNTEIKDGFDTIINPRSII